MGVPRSNYYRWRRKGVEKKPRGPSWNSLSLEERALILAVSEEHPEWYSRQIALYITDYAGFSVSESMVYRVLKKAGKIPVRREETQRAAREYADSRRRCTSNGRQISLISFCLPGAGIRQPIYFPAETLDRLRCS